jgi:DUF4097 and DUF4098 domain-containing protein YvlB
MNNAQNLRSTFKSSRSRVGSAFAVSAIVLTMFFSTTAFASSPQGTFDRTLQVNGPVDLEALTRSGDITVRAGSSGSVQIHGKIFVNNHWFHGDRDSDVKAIEQNPPIHQDGNRIHIDYLDTHDISVDYEITVPADTVVHSRTGSGDQVIEGTHGNVDAETGSGNVKLSNVTGDIHMHTGSGDVRGHQVSGPIQGGTGSGDIEIEETGQGDIDFHTGSGNITVRGVQGAFHAQTGSGDITAEGTQSGTWEVHTGSGNVHVRLPANAAFDADIATSSGTIDVGSPIEMTVQGRVNETRKEIRGKVRGGGPLLSVRTGSGDIHIE